MNILKSKLYFHCIQTVGINYFYIIIYVYKPSYNATVIKDIIIFIIIKVQYPNTVRDCRERIIICIRFEGRMEREGKTLSPCSKSVLSLSRHRHTEKAPCKLLEKRKLVSRNFMQFSSLYRLGIWYL